jgi:hypothetical protein
MLLVYSILCIHTRRKSSHAKYHKYFSEFASLSACMLFYSPLTFFDMSETWTYSNTHNDLIPVPRCYTNTLHTGSLEMRIFNIMKQLYYRNYTNRKRGEVSMIHLLISVVIYRPLTGTPWTRTTGGTTSPSPSRRQSKHCLLFTLHCHKYL